MPVDDYASRDALDLAALVRSGEASALEVVDACIARLEALDPALNAVVTRDLDAARDAARGPLPAGPFQGVPFFVKDLVQPVAGMRFTRGSRLFAGDRPGADGELVRRYRQAGLVIVGRTNTPELGLTPVTESALHGAANNPWSPGHNTGGSSGGSGAVVAARIAPMAHGGDGGGSLRVPASCCGVFGLKPSRGRNPAGPDHSEAWMGLAAEHALTRSVRDSAALLDATLGADPGAPYDAIAPAGPYLAETTRPPGRLRIALCRRPVLPGTPHPDVLAAVDDAAALCASLGHEVEEVTLPVDADRFALDFTALVAVSIAAELDDARRVVGHKASRRDVETATWVVGMLGRTIGGLQLEQARRSIGAMSRRVAAFMDRYDVILTPTLGAPPPRHGELAAKGAEARVQELIAATGLRQVLSIQPVVDAIAAKTFAFIPYTPLANATGQPSMSVPLWWNAAGLPVGSMFTARVGDEATLFRLAAQLEQARPWRDRVPPLGA